MMSPYVNAYLVIFVLFFELGDSRERRSQYIFLITCTFSILVVIDVDPMLIGKQQVYSEMVSRSYRNLYFQ